MQTEPLELSVVTPCLDEADTLGIGLIGIAARKWQLEGFGPLDYAQTMRWVIPGVTLAAVGFQTLLSGWFVSILGMNRVEMKSR
ncbi:MAG: hypothetical protein VCC67_00560 [Myxococcota bacterium]